jgi:hypothetical protein
MHSGDRKIPKRKRHRPLQISGKKQDAAEQFHYRITYGNRLTAIRAPAVQRNIGKYGDILIPFDRSVAQRTMRRRLNHAFITRETPNAYIEKTRDASTHCESKETEYAEIRDIHGQFLNE